MKYTFIFLVSLLLVCSCQTQTFFEIYQITDEYKLFVIPIRLIIERNGTDEKLLIPQGFVIDNKETIEGINKEWGNQKIEESDIPYYKIYLVKNGEISRSLSINKDLTILLTGHGFFKFNSKLLFKHKESFEYLNWYNIQTEKISNAKKLLSELNKGNFIYPHFIQPKSDFQEYLGSITVKRKKIPEVENYQKTVQNDFEIDSIFMRSKRAIGEDSVSLNFWTKKELPKKGHKDYIVTKIWKEFENIEFEVSGCDIDVIETAVKKLNIEVEIKTVQHQLSVNSH